MRILRPAAERGTTEIGWLHSRHSFSFGEYWDEAWMGFQGLRVINDDVIEPGQGFGTHPHRDMEIITWVLDGALEHRDSTGGGGVMRHGDVQVMSAGRGIRHSEFNHSKDESVRLLQVWIQPGCTGIPPAYAQANVPAAERTNRWAVLAAGAGRPSAVAIAADAAVLTAELSAGKQLSHVIAVGRHAWLHVARGSVTVDGQALGEGDAIAVSDEPGLSVTAVSDAELLLFDLV
jgi:quercetin 2,3-dioxygenase